VPYGNTFWDGGGSLLQMELPPPASVLRSSMHAQQHQQQAPEQPAATTSQRARGQAALEVTQSLNLDGDSSLLPLDPSHSISRTFAAPLSASRMQRSPGSNRSLGGRARTPMDQSMAADSFLIYPAGKGVPVEQPRAALGATLETEAQQQEQQQRAASTAAEQPPGPGSSTTSSSSGAAAAAGTAPAAIPTAAAAPPAPAAGASSRATAGTPLHLEELYSRNEAKLKMLAALQGGPGDKEALETFLARWVARCRVAGLQAGRQVPCGRRHGLIVRSRAVQRGLVARRPLTAAFHAL
jgi:hypothetical protein